MMDEQIRISSFTAVSVSGTGGSEGHMGVQPAPNSELTPKRFFKEPHILLIPLNSPIFFFKLNLKNCSQ